MIEAKIKGNEVDICNDYSYIAGVDEAGRGCLCGDVVAAAVILPQNHQMIGLEDSKKLSEFKREQLAEQIKKHALAYAIVAIDAKIIDQINILQATLLAMKKSVEKLAIQPDICFIDGNQRPKITLPCVSMIKGDALVATISAASILAKVARDQSMLELHKKYPMFGFDRHKGYGTAFHLEMMHKYGLLDCYRRSYKPVQQVAKEFLA